MDDISPVVRRMTDAELNGRRHRTMNVVYWREGRAETVNASSDAQPALRVIEGGRNQLVGDIDPPAMRRCAVCGEGASYGFGPPGFSLQPAEAWYCGAHRHEGERVWAARYRPGAA